ncbi:MAG: signal recognition particle-docking protein FtsY [Armatimonadota bacterium]|jgi:fused signal recognition particle receptor
MLKGLLGKVGDLLRGGERIDDELLEQLEDALVEADVGVEMALDLVKQLRQETRRQKLTDAGALRKLLQEKVASILGKAEVPIATSPETPAVFMVVGVNGVGKTTSIAKIAHWYKANGYSVLLSAADTFRAAAIEQLETWAGRIGCDFVKHQAGADPGAVVYDSLEAARARGIHVVIVDTAGRLHTRTSLMEELRKVRRVIERELARPPDETLLVLDGTMGQNAIAQARQFRDAVDVTGLMLAKLDGTAKGGAVLTIVEELGIPVKLIGVGERLEDLALFSAEAMAANMLD